MQVPPLYCTSQKQMPWWHSPWPEQLSVQLAFGWTVMKVLRSGYSLLGKWATLLVGGDPRQSTMLDWEKPGYTSDVLWSHNKGAGCYAIMECAPSTIRWERKTS